MSKFKNQKKDNYANCTKNEVIKMLNKCNKNDLTMKLYITRLKIKSYENYLEQYLPNSQAWEQSVNELINLKSIENELSDIQENYQIDYTTRLLLGNEPLEVYTYYEQNIGQLSPIIKDSIKAYMQNGITEDLICEAIKDAAKNNRRSWRYIDTVLTDKTNRGIKTLDEYINDREEYRAKKNKKVKTKITEAAEQTNAAKEEETEDA